MDYTKIEKWFAKRGIVLEEGFAYMLSGLAKEYKKKQIIQY